MRAAEVLKSDNGMYRSTIRVSTLYDHLFAHSAYPTLASDAVFFGPDTYRFASFLRANLDSTPRQFALGCADVGCALRTDAVRQ